MLNKQQKAVIHVAKNQLRLDEDTYRTILKTYGKVESSRDLNEAGFEQVMKYFRTLGFRMKRKKANLPPATTIITRQMFRIENLYNKLGWTDKKRQIGFNQRMIKKAWPQTTFEANKIIEALKAMIEREERNE